MRCSLAPDPMDVSQADVRVTGARVAGWFVWPHDLFFRPLVGLFTGRELADVIPTARQWCNRQWWCSFEAEKPDGMTAVVCLETGAVLWPEPAPASLPRTVEDILIATRSGSSPLLDGFPAFLALPLRDQIDILYRDFLGKSVSFEELAWLKKLDTFSILDLRDALASDEESKLWSLQPGERRGDLCLWSGFKQVTKLLDTPSEGLSSETIARIALGAAFEPSAAARFLAEHRSSVEAYSLEPRRDAAARFYTTGNLLPIMKSGPGVLRDAEGRLQSHQSGVVAYGPYMPLVPGRYRVTLDLAAAAPVGLEVVQDDITLAKTMLFPDEAIKTNLAVSFVVPEALERLFGKSEIEFRVTGEGATQLRTVHLSVHADGPDQPLSDLAAFTPGDAGRRVGASIGGLPQAGRVFYGPYCGLLPGHYRFVLRGHAAGSGALDIEAVSANAEVLTQRAFSVEGEICIELRFALPAVFTTEELAKAVEIRLNKSEGFGLENLSGQLWSDGDGR